TKAMPQEMPPGVATAIIQIVVVDLLDAGIEDVISATGYHKTTTEEHFARPSMELTEKLRMGGPKRLPLLQETERISELAKFHHVRQKGPYGNGTPLLNVRSIIGDEPFIYTWSDDFILAEPKSRFKELIEIYEEFGWSVLASIKAK